MLNFQATCDGEHIEVIDRVSDAFSLDVHFDDWMEAVASFRNRELPASGPSAYLETATSEAEDVLTFYDDFEDKISTAGTLVITEHGKLQANVEVTTAMIDGVFKGKMIATQSVILENHALVIGDIYTPEITIRGGAIVEGKIHCDRRPLTSWERPRWEVLKEGFARVWRGRIFS